MRYYHCGEYGSTEFTQRPHYHALIFGFEFPDVDKSKPWSYSDDDNQPLYRSKILEEIWGMGHCLIGAVTFKSAAYVARYIMKKINGDQAEQHYVNQKTGEILTPEYTTMSLKHGIGFEWIIKYMDDVYPDDFVLMNGKKLRPPAYYDKIYEIRHPQLFLELKEKREQATIEHADNNTPQRLKTRETIQKARLKNLPRKLKDIK